MISVLVLASTKVVSAALGAAVAHCTKVLACHTSPEAALASLRAIRADVLLLLPHFGKRVDVSLLREIAALPSPPRVVVLCDEAVDHVLKATSDLPPLCRVSLSAPLGQVSEAVLHGRAASHAADRKRALGGQVTLPTGVNLTARQAEVLRLHCQGVPAVEIARRLGISQRTVETLMRQIRQRTGIESNAMLTIELRSWALADS